MQQSQFNAITLRELKDTAMSVGYPEICFGDLEVLFNNSLMELVQVRDMLFKSSDTLVKITEFWDALDLGAYSLTSVGMAIAIANIRAKTNKQLEYSTWIN